MTATKHAGDPTPRSPSSVLADRGYRTIINDLGWGPQGVCVYLVVFHAGTETFWEVNYDSPDADKPARWPQVTPTTVQRVEYRRVP